MPVRVSLTFTPETTISASGWQAASTSHGAALEMSPGTRSESGASRPVGVMLVVVGIVGSSIAWYYANLTWTFGILFATAMADLLLFSMVGNALMCYRCGAQYRGVAEMESHGPFNLETHEKYRQLAARLGSTPQGT